VPDRVLLSSDRRAHALRYDDGVAATRTLFAGCAFASALFAAQHARASGDGEAYLAFGQSSLALSASGFSARGADASGRVRSADASGRELGLLRPRLNTLELGASVGTRWPIVSLPVQFLWGSRDGQLDQAAESLQPGHRVYGVGLGVGIGAADRVGPLTLRAACVLGFQAVLVPIDSLVDVKSGGQTYMGAVRGLLQPRLGADVALGRNVGLGGMAGFDALHPGEWTALAFVSLRTDGFGGRGSSSRE
jgi:hypothetical protein